MRQQTPLALDKAKIQSLTKSWHNSPKKWVIIGVMTPNSIDKTLLEALCNDPSVVVFTETTSNILHPKAIGSIDVLLAPLERASEEYKRFIQPEIILSFGGMVVFKKNKSIFAKFPSEASLACR